MLSCMASSGMISLEEANKIKLDRKKSGIIEDCETEYSNWPTLPKDKPEPARDPVPKQVQLPPPDPTLGSGHFFF